MQPPQSRAKITRFSARKDKFTCHAKMGRRQIKAWNALKQIKYKFHILFIIRR